MFLNIILRGWNLILLLLGLFKTYHAFESGPHIIVGTHVVVSASYYLSHFGHDYL